MQYFDNQIFVCSTDSEIRDITTGTRFQFKKYGGIISAKFVGKNIVNGELIGMVNQQGELEAIFNYCNSDSQFYSGNCSFKPKKNLNKSSQLHVLWNLFGNEIIENNLVLDELSNLN
ncbi:hypothetical protein [Bacillus sp. T3]|uniref:hypothetical protein n=1 Tax=Bacillus sp. T3 TaxID=467262 RepID=UPI002981E1C8|nr:hypothetical protein [Bacillus sp. T3]